MLQKQKNMHTSALNILWARRLLQLYPAAWRERYQEEILTILEEHPPTFKALIDLLLNLCDAHLHTGIVQGRTPTMLKQLQRSEAMIFCVGLVFCLISFIRQALFPIMTWGLLSIIHFPTSALLSQMLLLLRYLSYILFLLLLLYSLPSLFSRGWKACKTRQIRYFLLYLAGLLSPCAAFLISSTLHALLNSFFTNALPHYLFSFFSLAEIMKIAARISDSIAAPVFLLIVGTGLWMLKTGLRQSVPHTYLTKLTSILMMVIPLVMLLYIIILGIVFWILFLTPITWGEIFNLEFNTRFLLLPLVCMLIALYALVRSYQTQRMLAIQAR